MFRVSVASQSPFGCRDEIALVTFKNQPLMFRLYVVFHGSPCKSKVITLFTKNSIVAHFLTLLFFSIFAVHDKARFCTIPFDFKVGSIEMLPHLCFVVMCKGTS